MVILVLSPRLTESRRASFRAVTQGLGEIRFVVPGGPPPDVAEYGAIVVDGPQPAQPLEFLGAIRAAVERGAALLAVGCAPAERDGFWADLLGAIAGPEPPLGEYYARVTEAHSHISARITREFAVVDGFVPLIPLADGKVIVDVSVALRNFAAVVETPRGAGRVVACGLGNTDAALRTPELAQLLAGALRPDLHCGEPPCADGPPEPPMGSRLRGRTARRRRRAPRRDLQRGDVRGRLRASLPDVALGHDRLRRRRVRLGIAPRRLGAPAPRRPSTGRPGARAQARVARRHQSGPDSYSYDLARWPRSRISAVRHRRGAPAQVLRAGHRRHPRRHLPNGHARGHRAWPRIRCHAGASRGSARRALARALRERIRDQRATPAAGHRAALRVPPEPRRSPAPRRAARHHVGFGSASHRRARGRSALEHTRRGTRGDRGRGDLTGAGSIGWGVIGATSQVAQKAVLPAIVASSGARLAAVA